MISRIGVGGGRTRDLPDDVDDDDNGDFLCKLDESTNAFGSGDRLNINDDDGADNDDVDDDGDDGALTDLLVVSGLTEIASECCCC